jgi:hypothetical protein
MRIVFVSCVGYGSGYGSVEMKQTKLHFLSLVTNSS